MGLINAVKKAWNVFNRDPTRYQYNTGPGYSFRPDRVRFSRGNERSIVTSVYNRIALDVAALQSSLDSQASTFESIASTIPLAVEIDNPVVVVRYLDSAGTELVSREFTPPAE